MALTTRRRTVPKPESREDWLAVRRPYFNASSASVLWDRHPFLTAADYAVEKLTGRAQGETRSMRRGRYLEAAIADWWQREYGAFLWVPEALYVADPIMATLDGLTTNADVIVEIKTANGYVKEPEQYWLDQVQAQMLCGGIDHAVIVWLDSSMDMQVAEVDADEAFQAELLRRAERFMAAIELGIVPDWIVPELTAGHVAAIYPDAEGEVELDADTVELIGKYRELRAGRDESERLMDSLKNVIVRKLGEHAVGTFDGAPVVTYKSVKDSETVDVKRMRKDWPDIVEQYVSTKPGGRRFLPAP